MATATRSIVTPATVLIFSALGHIKKLDANRRTNLIHLLENYHTVYDESVYVYLLRAVMHHHTYLQPHIKQYQYEVPPEPASNTAPPPITNEANEEKENEAKEKDNEEEPEKDNEGPEEEPEKDNEGPEEDPFLAQEPGEDINNDVYFTGHFPKHQFAKYVQTRFDINMETPSKTGEQVITKLIFMKAAALVHDTVTKVKVLNVLATQRLDVRKVKPLVGIRMYCSLSNSGTQLDLSGTDKKNPARKAYGTRVAHILAPQLSLLPNIVKSNILASLKAAQDIDSKEGYTRCVFLPAAKYYIEFMLHLKRFNNVYPEDIQGMISAFVYMLTMYTFVSLNHKQSMLHTLLTESLNSSEFLEYSDIMEFKHRYYSMKGFNDLKGDYDEWMVRTNKNTGLEQIPITHQVETTVVENGGGRPAFRLVILLIRSLKSAKHEALADELTRFIFSCSKVTERVADDDWADLSRAGVNTNTLQPCKIPYTPRSIKVLRKLPRDVLKFRYWVFEGAAEGEVYDKVLGLLMYHLNESVLESIDDSTVPGLLVWPESRAEKAVEAYFKAFDDQGLLPPIKQDEDVLEHDLGLVVVVKVTQSTLLSPKEAWARYEKQVQPLLQKIRSLEVQASEKYPALTQRMLVAGKTSYVSDIFIVPLFVLLTNDPSVYSNATTWKNVKSSGKSKEPKQALPVQAMKKNLASLKSTQKPLSLLKNPKLQSAQKTTQLAKVDLMPDKQKQAGSSSHTGPENSIIIAHTPPWSMAMAMLIDSNTN